MKKSLFLMVLAALAAISSSCSPEPPDETLSAQEQAGRQLFTQHCAACHSTQAGTVIVGPSLAGIASRAGMAESGVDAAAYIKESIMAPSAHIVEGFDDLMPPTLSQVLSTEDVEALVSYLLTLK